MAQPSKTLYVNNLNDKTKKPELRHSLYQLFAPYGRIADIVALKTKKARGQAFIAFESQAAATAALRSLGGEVFYGKPLKIAYAKTPSKALSADAMAYVPAGAMSKVTVSHAQKEADDLKRAREEEDTIAERGEKRQKGDGDEETEDAEMSDDDEPGPRPA